MTHITHSINNLYDQDQCLYDATIKWATRLTAKGCNLESSHRTGSDILDPLPSKISQVNIEYYLRFFIFTWKKYVLG